MIFDIPKYDDWKLDTPDNHLEVIGECAYCGRDIYKGEPNVSFSEGNFHTDCWWEREDEELLEEE